MRIFRSVTCLQMIGHAAAMTGLPAAKSWAGLCGRPALPPDKAPSHITYSTALRPSAASQGLARAEGTGANVARLPEVKVRNGAGDGALSALLAEMAALREQNERCTAQVVRLEKRVESCERILSRQPQCVTRLHIELSFNTPYLKYSNI